MESLTLQLRPELRVAVATLHWKADNRLHPVLLGDLLALLDAVEADDSIGALVVTGSDPKFFSNGLDLEWLAGHVADPQAIVSYLRQVNAVFKRLTLFAKPTVAALNGHTFAAGLFLAAHMDFRFMRADRGWICMPEVDINIPLMPGMLAICQATMSAAGFGRLYYTGQRMTGPEAQAIGFVTDCFPLSDLVERSVAFAAELAKKKTSTYAEMKRRLRGEIARILDEEDPPLFLSTLRHALPD